MPGLIAAVDSSVHVGGAVKIFDFAWLFGVRAQYTLVCTAHCIDTDDALLSLQFFVSVTVYSFLSLMFPAKETFLDQAITGGESLEDSEADSASQTGKQSVEDEVKSVV